MIERLRHLWHYWPNLIPRYWRYWPVALALFAAAVAGVVYYLMCW
jgi:phage shock protein PspC (stress-responsive transcriptional regulator)